MRDGFRSAILLLVLLPAPMTASGQEEQPYALVIHGGAGTMRRSDFTVEIEAKYRAKLQEAL